MALGAAFSGTTGETWIKRRLLDRGWNVATPMVDVGDDLFTFRGAGRDLVRIQVKTGAIEDREYGYSARFNIPTVRIHATLDTPLYFLFVVEADEDLGPLLTIPQPDLANLVDDEEMGTNTAGDSLQFYVRYHRGDDGDGIEKVLCTDSDLTDYLDDLSHWPPLDHHGSRS